MPSIENRRPLFVGCPRIDVAHAFPALRRENVSRNLDDFHVGQSGYVDAVDLALLDVIGKERVAGTAVRVFTNPAATQRPARTRLEQRALQTVGFCGRRGDRSRLGHGLVPSGARAAYE